MVRSTTIARSSGKPIWFLNDPIEDNPRHSWTDYRANWESTLVASLLQPAVSRYEVLPWPDRIFGLTSLRPSVEPSSTNPNPPKTVIPKGYETELQTVFHALAEMRQPPSAIQWESAGTQNIGILVSDTLMFERAAPDPSDAHLGQFYGIALPLLMRGMPVKPVQIESTYDGTVPTKSLSTYKILLLTYDGQKPPSAAFHTSLAAWVRAGGALIVIDDDKDPYNQASDWWNSGRNSFATPRDHLFQMLGLASNATGLHAVGKGYVLFEEQSPAALANSPSGSLTVLNLLQTAAKAARLPLTQKAALILRRGPYVIAAGLDAEPGGASSEPAVSVRGDLINLFDPNLGEANLVEIKPGTRAFLLDVDRFPSSKPRILAASAKVSKVSVSPSTFSFQAEGIENTRAVVRILSMRAARGVTANGKPFDPSQYEQSGRTLLLHFTNTAEPQQIRLQF